MPVWEIRILEFGIYLVLGIWFLALNKSLGEVLQRAS
jgi:hypothetical protein